MRSENKVIALCGFMFSGKTKTARLIAEKTGRHLYDLDSTIESKTGVKIFDIFKLYGEERFRKLECESLSEVIKNAVENPRGAVIALGGGTAANAKCRRQLLKTARLVYLKASFGEIIRRIGAADEVEIISRPLLYDKNFKRLEKLYKSRLEYYELCGIVIDCDGLSIDETASQIIKAVGDNI